MPEENQAEPIAREGEHRPPKHGESAYHCPYCGVLASMDRSQLHRHHSGFVVQAWTVYCGNCSKEQFWVQNDAGTPEMVRPRGGGPRPHAQMPDGPRRDYVEASSILAQSPRGAAALLRLASQKLVNDLVPGKGNLDDKIGTLVSKGLPEEVAQALDVLRVVGNNAVHPGEITLDDDAETATALFECLNVIVEDRIARPQRIGGLFGLLPRGARDAIERRNARKALPVASSDTDGSQSA